MPLANLTRASVENIGQFSGIANPNRGGAPPPERERPAGEVATSADRPIRISEVPQKDIADNTRDAAERKSGVTGRYQDGAGAVPSTTKSRSKTAHPNTIKVTLIDQINRDHRLKDRSRRIGTALLTKWRNNSTGICCPAVGTIAANLGWSDRTVQRGLKDLVTAGYMWAELRGQHRTPLYHFYGMGDLPPGVTPLPARGDSSDVPGVTAASPKPVSKIYNLEERGTLEAAPSLSAADENPWKKEPDAPQCPDASPAQASSPQAREAVTGLSPIPEPEILPPSAAPTATHRALRADMTEAAITRSHAKWLASGSRNRFEVWLMNERDTGDVPGQVPRKRTVIDAGRDLIAKLNALDKIDPAKKSIEAMDFSLQRLQQARQEGSSRGEAPPSRVTVRKDTPQWDAWCRYRGSEPPYSCKTNSWDFPSEWPPAAAEQGRAA
jgi:hypothetical protein